MKAVEKRLSTGTMLGMPHNMEGKPKKSAIVSREMCRRQ
jgi:hypothetical protein